MAAWVKAPKKGPSSAMTDSVDKRWSMKADRCADSRREALALAGGVHYCGQTQLSGPNRPLDFLPCHHADVTWRGPAHPCLHSPPVIQTIAETFRGQSVAQLHFGVYINWQVFKWACVSNSDILTMCKGMQGTLSEGFWQVKHKRLDLDLFRRIILSCSYEASFTRLTLLD